MNKADVIERIVAGDSSDSASAEEARSCIDALLKGGISLSTAADFI